MIEKPLFSVIVIYYNQMKYVEKAFDSVFEQNYPNIEIVFADDCSEDIDIDYLKGYCDTHKGSNIRNIIWQINEENIGTVKNINRAVKKCSGEYLLLFAADDALCDENVLTAFSEGFASAASDIYMISSQCKMMDVTLKVLQRDFVDEGAISGFGELSAHEQFKRMTQKCMFAMGATAMRMDMFKRFGFFDEAYKYIEDYTYFLKLTFSGGKIDYLPIGGLLHRDGGISHFDSSVAIPPHVVRYRYELLKMFEEQMFPYMHDFSRHEKSVILNTYRSCKRDYELTGEGKKTASEGELLRYFGKAYIFAVLSRVYNRIGAAAGSYKNALFGSFIMWVSLCILRYYFSDNEAFAAILDIGAKFLCPALFAFFALICAAKLCFRVLRKVVNLLRRFIKR